MRCLTAALGAPWRPGPLKNSPGVGHLRPLTNHITVGTTRVSGSVVANRMGKATIAD